MGLAQGRVHRRIFLRIQADSFSICSLPRHTSVFHFQRWLPFITGQGVRVGLDPLLPRLTVLHRLLCSPRSPRSHPRLFTKDPDFIMGAWNSGGLPTEASFLLLCYATLGLCVWDQLIARSGPSICQAWKPWCGERSRGPHSATMPINNANRVPARGRDGVRGRTVVTRQRRGLQWFDRFTGLGVKWILKSLGWLLIFSPAFVCCQLVKLCTCAEMKNMDTSGSLWK